MKEVKIFNNQEFGNVRTLPKGEEVWFVGKDIATILGYVNSKDALNTHVDKENRGVIQRSENTTLEIPNRGLTIINESGLYSLILSSKLPKAKDFKRWVTSEILPTIRKHGMYATEDLLNNPDFLIQVAMELKKEKEQNKILSLEVAKTTQMLGELQPKID